MFAFRPSVFAAPVFAAALAGTAAALPPSSGLGADSPIVRAASRADVFPELASVSGGCPLDEIYLRVQADAGVVGYVSHRETIESEGVTILPSLPPGVSVDCVIGANDAPTGPIS